MKFTNTMFDDIKNARKAKSDAAYKDILKFEAGKTYQLRLVPNLDEPKRTIFHYYHHSWMSLSTNKFVTAICATTFGESCPICSHAIKTYRGGSEIEKEQNKLINRKENWLVNAYVVSDPTNADNTDKVKILRYGRELAKVIDEAIDGEDSQEFGSKIFDVVNGCSLRVKCEARSGAANKKQFVSYSSSKFVAASTVEVEDITSVHEGIFKLEEVFKTSSAPELQRLLEQHYLCSADADSADSDDDDDVNDALKRAVQSSQRTVATPKTSTPDITQEFASVFDGVSEAKEVKEPEGDSLNDLDEELRGILEKF